MIGGYPVIVKPDVGVGAADTWKLENEKDLEWFYNNLPEHPYVMEEFVYGNIYSYDAICDLNGDVLFESSNWLQDQIEIRHINRCNTRFNISKISYG